MYKLYTDKSEVFECKISLEGASLKNSQARLVIESEDLTLMFKGKIELDGQCTIPIKKLKGLLEESTQGSIKLEVIAEDVYFTPWKSDFVVDASRKVTVEVKSQNAPLITENKPSIKVEQISQPTREEIDHVTNIIQLLVKENINLDNLVVKKNKVNNIVATYLSKNKVDNLQKSKIIEGIINKLP